MSERGQYLISKYCTVYLEDIDTCQKSPKMSFQSILSKKKIMLQLVILHGIGILKKLIFIRNSGAVITVTRVCTISS